MDKKKTQKRFGTKLQIFGWLWTFFGNIISMFAVAMIFPDGVWQIVLYVAGLYVGEIAIIFGFQMNRKLDGRCPSTLIEFLKLVRSLSIVQWMFLLGGCFIVLDAIFQIRGDLRFRYFDTLSELLFLCGFAVWSVRLLYRFVRWIIKVRKEKKNVANAVAQRKNGSAEIPKMQPKPIKCLRCGNEIPSVKEMVDGICLTCLDEMTDPVDSTSCCVCDDLFGEEALIYCDGNYYCESCFRKKFEV